MEMRAAAAAACTTPNCGAFQKHNYSLPTPPTRLNGLNSFPAQRSHLGFVKFNSKGLCGRRSLQSVPRAIVGGQRSTTAWDDKPYEVLPGGKILYLDEQDVVSFLDPPKELIPLDPSSYNPASYLWKKIEDVPEERRHRLLPLIEPRLISRAWEIAGTRYEDPKLVNKSGSDLLGNKDGKPLVELWNCRTSGGPKAIAWMNFFRKAIVSCNNGLTYGRLMSGSVTAEFTNSLTPLYFTVRQLKEVMSTEQPCDFAYEFGDGLFDFHDYPSGFPTPAEHSWPFNDEVVMYVRQLGPGVVVGQAWQEGEALDKLPQKLCSEILMVKHYDAQHSHM